MSGAQLAALAGDGDQPCLAARDGYSCTAASGHQGVHVAWDSDGQVCAAWPPPAAGGAELAARRTAARAALTDFYRDEADEPLSATAWTGWCLRLAAELASLLDVLKQGDRS